MDKQKVVVIGGGYAGVLATQRLARRGVDVTLVSAEAELVDRIRLHEVAAGSAPVRRPLAQLLARETKLRVARVARLGERVLHLEGGETMAADFVLLATGSASDTARIPGAAEHTHQLDGHARTLAFAAGLRSGGRLLVIGGGPTAIEAASELAERHRELRVQLVASGLLPGFSPAAQAHVRGVLCQLGVEILEDTRVHAVEPGVADTSRGRLGFDHALYAAGFAPSSLARDSGLPVDERGRLLVDATMTAVGVPWLLGAGDAAVAVESVGAPLEMSCKCALPMGAAAADGLAARLAGGEARPLSFRDNGLCVSLGRREGLIQLRGGNAENTRILRGRTAVWTKELVARYVPASLRLSRWVKRGYYWREAPRQPAQLAAHTE